MSNDVKKMVNDINKADPKKDSDDDVNNNENSIITDTCFIICVLCVL